MKQQLFGGLAAFAAALSSTAAALPIADHRAVYEMTLARTGAGSGVQGVSGEMALEVRDHCDTMTVNQRFRSDFWGAEGKPKHSELTLSSTEARDGSSFRFSLNNKVEGATAEQFKGEAKRGKAGGDGSITYEDAAFPPASLPKETIFPSEHMRQLLAAAEAGKMTLSALVFDGAEKAKIYRASAIIGRRTQGGTAPKGLEGLAHWPVSISYFPTTSQEPMPEYETNFDLYANGVSGTLDVDYGDFAMKGELAAFELLPKGKCAGN